MFHYHYDFIMRLKLCLTEALYTTGEYSLVVFSLKNNKQIFFNNWINRGKWE